MGAFTATDRLTVPTGAASELQARVIDAMLECIERWGIAKTTADDVARTAGVSRATLYRAFPGGKDVVFAAVVRHETARFFRTVTERLDATQHLDDLLTTSIVEAARFLTGHRALNYVFVHEPERVLPAVAFDRFGQVLDIATAFTAPHLRRFVPDDESAARAAEWVLRILISYAVNPSPRLRLTDEADVRRFVTTYLVPALTARPDQPTDRSAPKEP